VIFQRRTFLYAEAKQILIQQQLVIDLFRHEEFLQLKPQKRFFLHKLHEELHKKKIRELVNALSLVAQEQKKRCLDPLFFQ